jgi:DNA-binding MarR family transcriptional regulator
MYSQLKLENQLCFPIYASSRLITRLYQPLLDELDLTYPQYLVLLVLWENDGLSVKEISEKLILNTNTSTPLLKRMQQQGLITRNKSEKDERKVLVHLTEKANLMKEKAAKIPHSLFNQISDSDLSVKELIALKETLDSLINHLSKK